MPACMCNGFDDLSKKDPDMDLVIGDLAGELDPYTAVTISKLRRGRIATAWQHIKRVA